MVKDAATEPIPPAKVSILGAGALGAIYGAYLSESGCAVTLVARRVEQAQAINAHGLRLRFGDSVKAYKQLRAVAHISEAPDADLLLFMVKGPDTAEAVRSAAPHIAASCTLLTLQNGLGNVEEIARFIPAERIMAGVSYNGATRLNSGEVAVGGSGPTILGEMDGSITPRLERITALFNRAGLVARVSDNIIGHIWTKAIVNCAINPLAALTGLTNGRLAAYEESRVLMRQLAGEAATVARRLGIRLEADDPAAYALAVAENTGGNMASMLQDILHGRPTEIDSINGAIAAIAAQAGVEAPLNAAFAGMVRLLEKRSLT